MFYVYDTMLNLVKRDAVDAAIGKFKETHTMGVVLISEIVLWPILF